MTACVRALLVSYAYLVKNRNSVEMSFLPLFVFFVGGLREKRGHDERKPGLHVKTGDQDGKFLRSSRANNKLPLFYF